MSGCSAPRFCAAYPLEERCRGCQLQVAKEHLRVAIESACHWKAQRDVLLDACREALALIEAYADEIGHDDTFRVLREAIARADGK